MSGEMPSESDNLPSADDGNTEIVIAFFLGPEENAPRKIAEMRSILMGLFGNKGVGKDPATEKAYLRRDVPKRVPGIAGVVPLADKALRYDNKGVSYKRNDVCRRGLKG